MTEISDEQAERMVAAYDAGITDVAFRSEEGVDSWLVRARISAMKSAAKVLAPQWALIDDHTPRDGTEIDLWNADPDASPSTG